MDLVTSYIAGADDYYNYSRLPANANNGTVDDDGTTYAIDANGTVTVPPQQTAPPPTPRLDFEDVGVTAVDEHTDLHPELTIFPGFLSLLCYLPYEPAYGPLLEEVGDQFCHQCRDHLQLRRLLPGRVRVSGDLDHEEESRELRCRQRLYRHGQPHLQSEASSSTAPR